MVGLIIASIYELYVLMRCIKKPDEILFMQYIYILFFRFLISFFGAPEYISYIADINNIILFIYILRFNKNKWLIKKRYIYTLALIFLFFIIGIFSSIINNVNLLLILWSIRVYGRFIIIFVATVYFWKKENTEKIKKIFLPILIINALISIYQHYLGIYSTDNIGGIFGTSYGVNTYSIIFYSIVLPYYIDSYINKKEKIIKLILALLCILISVVLADLKVFYVILILEFLIVNYCNGLNSGTLKIFFILGIGAIAIYYICLSFYENMNIFDINYITKYLTSSSYSYTEDSINRIGGIKIIDRLLEFSNTDKVFGLGLGSGEYNRFFSSEIYKKYVYTNYIWFSYAWIYLETGYIGLFLYFLINISMVIYLNKFRFNNANVRISLAVAITMLLLIIYNTALRIDAAYLLYITLGIGYQEISNKIIEKCK